MGHLSSVSGPGCRDECWLRRNLACESDLPMSAQLLMPLGDMVASDSSGRDYQYMVNAAKVPWTEKAPSSRRVQDSGVHHGFCKLNPGFPWQLRVAKDRSWKGSVSLLASSDPLVEFFGVPHCLVC